MYEFLQGARRFRFEHGGARITSMAFDRSDRRLITGIYTPISFHMSAILRFEHGGTRITSMAFDRSGRRLVTGIYTPISFHMSAIFML